MLTNHEPDWNIEDLTEAEIYNAIRYLEPHTNADETNDDNGVVICVCLYVVLAGCLSFLWFYWR
jgi:hypothetical protein